MIRRIEIDKKGGVTVEIINASQWYDFSVFPPRVLDPMQDTAIPLSTLARERRLKILAYRPRRRLVAAGRQDGIDVVLKGFRRGKGATQARKYRIAAAALDGSGTYAAKVLGISEKNDFLTMQREAGRRPTISTDRAEEFRLIGLGTRRLQMYREDLMALDTFGRQQELDVLDERIRRLKLAAGKPPGKWGALRVSLDEVAPLAPAAKEVLAHRDLHDGQWLVHRGRACLLDFDLLCRAEPELDPANFLAHLELRRLQYPNDVGATDVQACGQAFLDGLGLNGGRDSEARFAFYKATSFARLALVYQLRPSWQGLTADLVELGMRNLQDARDCSC